MANKTSTQQQTTTTQTTSTPVQRPQTISFRDSAQTGNIRNAIILNENRK